MRGVPQGVPGKKFVLRIPYRGPGYKRKIQRALDRAELYDIHVMETAGTTLASSLCPGKIDGGDACTLNNCWFCAGRMDDPKRRRECKKQMVIYVGQCMLCADAGITSKYVGQTQQRVKTRVGQHMAACRNANFMDNVPQQIQAVRANGGSDKHLPSAVGIHHHRHHEGLEPRWEWHVEDTAMTVNLLDAKEATIQTYGVGFNVNHNVVVGPQ